MMTQEEIIAELEAAIAHADSPNDVYTTRDLSRMLGVSLQKVRVRLQVLSEAGRLEILRVKRPNIAGLMQPRAAYRILPAEEE